MFSRGNDYTYFNHEKEILDISLLGNQYTYGSYQIGTEAHASLYYIFNLYENKIHIISHKSVSNWTGEYLQIYGIK